jgi:hypothetical protein
MFATVVPGLLEVIGIPVAFVVLAIAGLTGVYIFWNRARS